MEVLFLILAAVIAAIAYRVGGSAGERRGASQAQANLIKGATEDSSDDQQTALAAELGKVSRARPSSSKIKTIDEFVRRAFEVGQLIATANRDAGEAFQERTAAPRKGKVRVDLTLDEMWLIGRMADFGFRQMLQPEARSPFRIETREEAYKAANAIDSLSRAYGVQSGEDKSSRDLRIDASSDRQFWIASAFRNVP